MNPTQLREAGESLFGKRWKAELARRLSIDSSTVRRWVSGKVKIPGPAAAAIRCWMGEKA